MTMMEVLGVDNFGIFDRLGIINHNRSQSIWKRDHRRNWGNAKSPILAISDARWLSQSISELDYYQQDTNIRNSLRDQKREIRKDEEMMAMILSNLGLSTTYNMASSEMNNLPVMFTFGKRRPICLCVSDKSDSFVMTGAGEKVNRKW